MTYLLENPFRECVAVNALYDYQIQKNLIESAPDLPFEIFNNEIVHRIDALSDILSMSLVCKSIKTNIDECKSSFEAMRSSVSKVSTFIEDYFLVTTEYLRTRNVFCDSNLQFTFENKTIPFALEKLKFLFISHYYRETNDIACKDEKTLFMLNKIVPFQPSNLTSSEQLVFNFLLSKLNSHLKVKCTSYIQHPANLLKQITRGFSVPKKNNYNGPNASGNDFFIKRDPYRDFNAPYKHIQFDTDEEFLKYLQDGGFDGNLLILNANQPTDK